MKLVQPLGWMADVSHLGRIHQMAGVFIGVCMALCVAIGGLEGDSSCCGVQPLWPNDLTSLVACSYLSGEVPAPSAVSPEEDVLTSKKK